MKKEKKLDGFTLIELIIVMAIFGIIMLGVMKIADPLAKVMERSSTKEKSAAYVDNISDYLDKSMRYAKYMRVYEGEFSDYGMTEEEIAKDFVDTYYDGCISNDGSSVGLMKGKLHILKLINVTSYESSPGNVQDVSVIGADPTDIIKPGQVWDTVYKFTCGDSYKEAEEPDGTPIIKWKTTAKIELDNTSMAINPEHLENYGYYYRYGYSKFEVVSHDSSKVEGDDDSKNVTYSALTPDPTVTGSSRFAISIVAYPVGNKMKTVDDGSTWFKSPCYMNTMSMYLINADTAGDMKTDKMQKQLSNGDPDGDSLTPVITYDSSFFKYSPTGVAPSTDNLYFVYVVPSELYLN